MPSYTGGRATDGQEAQSRPDRARTSGTIAAATLPGGPQPRGGSASKAPSEQQMGSRHRRAQDTSAREQAEPSEHDLKDAPPTAAAQSVFPAPCRHRVLRPRSTVAVPGDAPRPCQLLLVDTAGRVGTMTGRVNLRASSHRSQGKSCARVRSDVVGTSPSAISLAEHRGEFGVGPELADLLGAAAGDGDLGSPLQRLLA